MDKMQIHEMISALADGQLRGEALDRVIQTVATDPQARSAWHTYHLVGDVLRSGNLPIGTAPAIFLAGFQVRLERERVHEPVAAAPRDPVRPSQLQRADAANDGSFRWKLVAGAASLAAVAAIGWGAAGELLHPPAAQLAIAPGAGTLVAGRPAVMIRDAKLDEMLAAHRQLGVGASALQMPAGFLRNATFEAPAR